MIFFEIQNFLKRGKLFEAIQYLFNIAITNKDNNLQKTICLLFFRYSILKEEQVNGTIDYDYAMRNQLVIGKSLLDIAESLC